LAGTVQSIDVLSANGRRRDKIATIEAMKMKTEVSAKGPARSWLSRQARRFVDTGASC